METLLIIGVVIVIALLYGTPLWMMGRDFKRQIMIGEELMKQKQNLKPGFVLNEKWYSLKKKSKSRRVIYIFIMALIGSIICYLGLHYDIRIYHIALLEFLAIFPAWLGYEGIIPLPGIDINT